MFYLLVISLFIGVASYSVSAWSLSSSAFLILVAMGLILFSRLLGLNSRVGLVSLVLLGFSFGMLRTEIAHRREHALDHLMGQTTTLVGKVSGEPEAAKFGTKFALTHASSSERILVTTREKVSVGLGDVVSVRGKLEQPENFDPNFNYVAYLAKDDIYYLLESATIASSVPQFSIAGGLLKARSWFVNNIGSYLPEPDTGLVSGISLGVRNSLSEEVEETFRRVGLSHIVVLSGYNLTVVAEQTGRALKFLPWRMAAWGSGAAIVAFALMAGAGPAVIRATIMALVVIFGRTTGRVYDATRALLVAALLMVLWNPKILVSDLGFQLSFVATLGILYLTPLFEARLKFLPARFDLREVVVTSLAAQVAVLPLILHSFGTLSLIAVPVNILILPIVPFLMFAGFLLAILGFLPLVWWPLSLLVHLLISCLMWLVTLSSRVPGGYLELPRLGIVLMLIWYGAYAYLIWRFNQPSKQPREPEAV